MLISQSSARDGKKLSKIIKEEAKVEKETLSLAITELGDAQKFQRASLKVRSFSFTLTTYVRRTLTPSIARSESACISR